MPEDTSSAPKDTVETTPSPTPEAAPAPQPTPEPVGVPVTAPPTPPVPAAVNGLAIASMVVGIVAVISGWIPIWGLLVSAAAIVLGALGLKRAGGKGMSITGIVTGSVGAIWAVIVSVLFVLAIISGAAAAERAREASIEKGKETQSLIDSKKNFEKGETAKFGSDLEAKINSVERNYVPGASFVPKEGKEFIVVNVTIKNVSDQSVRLRLSDFNIINNGDIIRFDTAPVTNGLKNSLLTAGGSTTVNLVYQVPLNATDLSLGYTVTIFGANYKSNKLDYTLAF